ncbi:MAG: hypothetical protein WKG07_10340 [Hymenobacter sp.]
MADFRVAFSCGVRLVLAAGASAVAAAFFFAIKKDFEKVNVVKE